MDSRIVKFHETDTVESQNEVDLVWSIFSSNVQRFSTERTDGRDEFPLNVMMKTANILRYTKILRYSKEVNCLILKLPLFCIDFN